MMTCPDCGQTACDCYEKMRAKHRAVYKASCKEKVMHNTTGIIYTVKSKNWACVTVWLNEPVFSDHCTEVDIAIIRTENCTFNFNEEKQLKLFGKWDLESKSK